MTRRNRLAWRAWRVVWVLGIIGILCSIAIATADPAARPNLPVVGYVILIAAAAGIASALVVRAIVPLEARLRFFLSLSPRLSRWFLKGRSGDGVE